MGSLNKKACESKRNQII